MHDVARGSDPDITFRLHATLQRHPGVVFPQVFLTLHALDCLIFFIPHAGNIQKDVRLPAALFWLMGFKTVDRWRLHHRFAGTIAFGLRDNASFLRKVRRNRMVVVIRILQRVVRTKCGCTRR